MTDQRLWHGFADMASVPEREITLVEGEGSWVVDDQGKRYLDGSASLWYCSVGHGRGELADAAAHQMRRLAAYNTFDVFTNEPAAELAHRLTESAPTGRGSAAFFTSGGSESVDTAAKLAHRYWAARGEDRGIVVAREGAYHGMAGYGTSLAGIAPNRVGWGTLMPDVVHVGADSVDELEAVLAEHAGKVAAFIGEPVRAAGGVYPPVEGYWEGVQRVCRDNDVLLIADEVVTGFGRLGTPYGSDRYGIRPDLLCAAKGLTSGYAPVGVVLVGARVRDELWQPGVGPIRHGYTYSGHPTGCAVALANLDLLEREGLTERVAALEPVLARELGALAQHPLVAEVRTVGLLGGVELDAGARERTPDLTERVVRRARDRGVIVRNLVGHSLQVSPPFVIEEEEIAFLASTVRDALDHVGAALEPAGTAGT